MKMDDELRKYIRPLIYLRRAAAELEKMSEFELVIRANEFGVGENQLRRYAHSDYLHGDRGSDKNE